MRFYFFVPILFLLASAIKPESSAASWRDTHLRFERFAREITDSACLQNELHFVGCMESLQQVLTALDLKIQTTAKSEIVRDFGKLKISKFADVSSRPLRFQQWKDLYKEVQNSRKWWRLGFWFEYFGWSPGFPPLDSVVDYVHTKFVTEENSSDLAAIGLNSLFLFSDDPHTHLIPKEIAAIQSQSEKSLRGLGFSMRKIDGHLVVDRVYRNTSAWASGLHIYDEITQIGSTIITSENLNSAHQMLSDDRANQITVVVKRGQEFVRVKMHKQTLAIENVSSFVSTDHAGGQRFKWGYLSISSFLPVRTCEDVDKQLKILKKEKIEGLILDLRENAGGLVLQGVCVANLFLNYNQLIIRSQDLRQGLLTDQHTLFKGSVDFPMVVLINHNTASASEIVAGSLQDHNRALVLGTPSFGKGTFQSAETWQENPSILIFRTTSKYYLPSGRSPQFVGITPDRIRYRLKEPHLAEISALRESDLFDLQNVKAAWKNNSAGGDPTRSTTNSSSSCPSRAQKRFQDGGELEFSDDYQALSAEDELACQVNRKKTISSASI